MSVTAASSPLSGIRVLAVGQLPAGPPVRPNLSMGDTLAGIHAAPARLRAQGVI